MWLECPHVCHIIMREALSGYEAARDHPRLTQVPKGPLYLALDLKLRELARSGFRLRRDRSRPSAATGAADHMVAVSRATQHRVLNRNPSRIFSAMLELRTNRDESKEPFQTGFENGRFEQSNQDEEYCAVFTESATIGNLRMVTLATLA
ncbi:hypothetical protein HPB50_023299 [Hyalomma asiaticum]|uniref:Uncharacterized protein n=1 Tax=Hyalomma asiaticum TaxID=266040 RepID=A0ACB7TTL0_HYAAI|nr:hypothetical protein HPB50_023299 [Hyalomma asiaticum]